MNIASLFAGIGGFDLGFQRAGMTCNLQVEKDAQCQSVLTRHFPNCCKLLDVTGEETIATLQRHGRFELICGGFPCQDLSVAGRRLGLAGEQSGLWFRFRDIIAAISPRWVVIENVVGLLSSNSGRDFGTIIRGLVELGYCCAWRVLDSQYFGVAQRRRRVFIVGHLRSCEHPRGNSLPARVLFEPESLPGNPPPRRKGEQDDDDRVRGVVKNCVIPNVAMTLKAKAWPSLRSSHETYIPCDYSTGAYRESNISSSLTGMTDRSRSALVITEGRQVRVLTPRERERLQGFPDDWTRYSHDGREISKSARNQMIGNAVTVNVAEWIGKRIMKLQQIGET